MTRPDLEETPWDRWPVALLASISTAVLLSVGSKLSHTSKARILLFPLLLLCPEAMQVLHKGLGASPSVTQIS